MCQLALFNSNVFACYKLVTSCTQASNSKKAIFRPRSTEEEEKIMQKCRNGDGVDIEDVKMLGLAYKRLKESRDQLVKDVHWAYYPTDILVIITLAI